MNTHSIQNQSLAEVKLWSWLGEIPDPEIPVVSILDLGIVRQARVVRTDEQQHPQAVKIGITPTYSGCPAMDLISMQIRMKLTSEGVQEIELYEILNPAWTTDWISEQGMAKMKAYGIAPPVRRSKEELALFESDNVPCPRCESMDTEEVSRFGSTSCKAMYHCKNCLEPFEHFKCH